MFSPAVTAEATKTQPFVPEQANMNDAIYYQIKFRLYEQNFKKLTELNLIEALHLPELKSSSWSAST